MNNKRQTKNKSGALNRNTKERRKKSPANNNNNKNQEDKATLVNSVCWIEGSLPVDFTQRCITFSLLCTLFSSSYIIHRSLRHLAVFMLKSVYVYAALAKIHDQYLCK